MKLLLEKWNTYLQEAEDMKRVSKAVMVGDIPEYNQGKILILRRAASSINDESPWEWDLPGGHAKEDESDKQALSREVKEETGFEPSTVPGWFLLDKSTRFFLLRDWTGKLSLSDEHGDYEWIYPDEAKNYNLGKVYLSAIDAVFNKEA